MRRTTFTRFAVLTLTSGVLITAGAEQDKPSSTGDSLLAHWTFDDAAGAVVRDSTGNGHDGTISHDMRCVTRVKGRNGKALAFTGNQATRHENGCVVVPSMPADEFSAGMTVSAWIKLAPSMVRSGTYEIVSNTFSDRGKGFRLRSSWQALNFVSGEGGNGKTWGASSNPSQTPIASGVWYHVAGTYDGSVFRTYLDGQLVGASAPGLALTRGRPHVYIGSYNDGYAYGFEGVIDDVRLFTRPLSALEVLRQAKLAP